MTMGPPAKVSVLLSLVLISRTAASSSSSSFSPMHNPDFVPVRMVKSLKTPASVKTEATASGVLQRRRGPAAEAEGKRETLFNTVQNGKKYVVETNSMHQCTYAGEYLSFDSGGPYLGMGGAGLLHYHQVNFTRLCY